MKTGTRHFASLYWLTALATCLAADANEETSPLHSVDPRIGSAHARWFFFTPAAVPFGMAKPSPCTDAHLGNKSGWEAVGYDPRHPSIEGFANFHEFQVGGVVLMPTIGKLVTVPGTIDKPEGGYRSRFDKAKEVAEPGYYCVTLTDYGIRAELTATPRVAFHRYTYPASTNAHLLFDIGNRQGESGPVLDAAVRWDGVREVEGFVITLPEYARIYQPGTSVKMYFVARFTKQPHQVGTFRGLEVFHGHPAILGPGAGLYLNFTTGPEEAIEVKIGQSYTSISNARANLDREAGEFSFDTARQLAQERWAEMLGRIEVGGGTRQDRVKFHTGLYHALLGRGLASDVDGSYPRNDGGVGHIPLGANGSPQYNHYNTDAVWGTFWNLTQLWALAYPEYFSEFVRCQLDMFRDCGWLPDSIATGKFVSGVGTDFMGLVLSSAYHWGIRDYDVQQAWAAVLKNETGWEGRPLGVGKADVKAFLDHGYVPHLPSGNMMLAATPQGSQFSGSHTLEYSFSAFAAAQFARALNRTEEYERLMSLSRGWERLFDSDTGCVRPKLADGKFLADFDPKKAWVGFQEGNAFQYTFYVPHDPAGLIRKVGPEKFNDRLDSVFRQSEKAKFGGGENLDAFAGVEAVYNHGNQPCLHIAWLFNYAGRPWLTQHWVRQICDIFYGTEPVHGYGYGQDEDQGQLGAWFVLAGIGLFDVQGGTAQKPSMQLGTPMFEEISIRLSSKYYPGQVFRIKVNGKPQTDRYIESAQLNGTNLEECWIPWSEIVAGGRLELTTASEPNKNWGTKTPPPSASSPD